MKELVQRNENGKPITTSLLVAEKFEKEHRVVITAIRNIIHSTQNYEQLFISTIYTDASGKANPMYLMNRDGFSILAMGFTGKKALAFKMDFLNAFNKMESMLNSDEYILMRSQEILQSKVKQLESSVFEKDRQLEEAAPKIEWHDINQSSIGLHKITTCVEKLSICAPFMNKVLMQYKVIRKVGHEYSFFAKYQNKGFGEQEPVPAGTHSDGTPRTRLEISYYEKGRRLIYEVFKHAQKDGFIVRRKDGRWVLSRQYGYTEFKFSE